MNHTPGPHSVVEDGQGNQHIVSRWAPDSVTEARWTFLAKITTPPVGTVLYKDGYEHTVAKGEDKANAVLFSLSSVLYETLVECPDLPDDWDVDNRDAIQAFTEAFKVWKEYAAKVIQKTNGSK